MSDFYDHWTFFTIRNALSVLKYRYRTELTPGFGVRGHTDLWFMLCCIHGGFSCFLALRLGFPLKWQNVEIICWLSWWESFDHIRAHKKANAGVLSWRNPTVVYYFHTSCHQCESQHGLHKTPSDHPFPISNHSTALCMIKNIYERFASCRCCHKSPLGPAYATGCLTNVPQ